MLSLHFSHTSIAYFQIHCVGVKRQNYKTCVNVQMHKCKSIHPSINYSCLSSIGSHRAEAGTMRNVDTPLTGCQSMTGLTYRDSKPRQREKKILEGKTTFSTIYTHTYTLATISSSKSPPTWRGLLQPAFILAF